MDSLAQEFNAENADIILLFRAARKVVHAGQRDVDHLTDIDRAALLKIVHDAHGPQLIARGIVRLGETVCVEHELHAGFQRNLTLAEERALNEPERGGARNRRQKSLAVSRHHNGRGMTRAREREALLVEIEVDVAGRGKHRDVRLAENAIELSVERREQKPGRIGEVCHLFHQPSWSPEAHHLQRKSSRRLPMRS